MTPAVTTRPLGSERDVTSVRVVFDRASSAGWKVRATALGLAVFLGWTLLANVGPLANHSGRIVLFVAAGLALAAGAARLAPRRKH